MNHRFIEDCGYDTAMNNVFISLKMLLQNKFGTAYSLVGAERELQTVLICLAADKAESVIIDSHKPVEELQGGS